MASFLEILQRKRAAQGNTMSREQRDRRDYERLVEARGKPKSLGDLVANYLNPQGTARGIYNAARGPSSLDYRPRFVQLPQVKQKKEEEAPPEEVQQEAPAASEEEVTEETTASTSPNSEITEEEVEKSKPITVIQDPITVRNPTKKKVRGGISQFASSGGSRTLPSIKSKLLNV